MLLIIGLLAMVFINLNIFNALIQGITVTLQNQIITTLAGHISIEPPDENTFISRASQVATNVERVPGVLAVSQRTKFAGEIQQQDDKSGVGTYPGLAIEPSAELAVTELAENIYAGRFLHDGEIDGLVLGSQVAGFDRADELSPFALDEAAVGDMVTVSFVNGQQQEFEVVGIVDNRFVQADNRFFITDSAYHSIFTGASDTASEIAVRVHSTTDELVVAQEIDNRDWNIEVSTWQDGAGLLETLNLIMGSLNRVVSGVSIIVAGFMIFIVMYIDVLNRKKQIGILRAIGISDSAITLSYIIRALVYTTIGVAIGTLLMKFVVLQIFEARPLGTAIGDVTLALDVSAMQIRSMIMILVAVLGAYVPMIYALRISIVDAIWGE